MTLPRVQTLASPEPTTASADRPALHVVTFGCQMNKYDSLLVEGRFREHGYRLTDAMEDADVVLFNTCSVRDHAEERVYSWLGALRRAKERRPDLVLGVMGCMAQRAEEEVFRRAAHVDLVCGTRQFQNLPELVDEVRARRASRPEAPSAVLEVGMEQDVRVDRSTRPYRGGPSAHLAVMRGCDLNCTFCIVPTTRGRVRSRPIDELVDEARWMIDGGVQVITLLGQTVDAYGEDLPADERAGFEGRRGRPGLADLLRALQGLDGLERIRLVTLHPAYVTEALARAVADCDKVDRFLPLPAQSGSDDVLRRMKRGYTTDLYRGRVDLLRRFVPDLELGSDWIVGFPGESEADFERTLGFVGEVGFAQGYVFQYSPRPGTRAFELADDVPLSVKKERNQRLLRAVERSALRRMERWVGEDVDVWVEEPSPRDEARLRGRTRHGLPASFGGEPRTLGRWQRLRVGGASPYGLTGEPLRSS